MYSVCDCDCDCVLESCVFILYGMSKHIGVFLFVFL